MVGVLKSGITNPGNITNIKASIFIALKFIE